MLASRRSGVTPLSRSPFQEFSIDQALRNLDSVKRGALAEIVRYDPHRQAVFNRRILADARDVGRILAGAFHRRGVTFILALLDDENAGRLAHDCATPLCLKRAPDL